MSVTQGTKVNLHPTQALRRGLRRDRHLERQFPLRPSPHDIIKAPDPLNVLPPRPRDAWSPLARRGAMGPPPRHLLPPMGWTWLCIVNSSTETTPWPNMTLVIPPRWHPYLYSDGVTATIPPTPLSTRIRAPVPPVLDGTEAHETKHGPSMLHQQMERPKDQCMLLSALQEKLLPSDKEEDGRTWGHLFCFLYHLFSILSFYHKCNPSPLLEKYKRGGRDPNGGGTQERTHAHTSLRQPHTHHPSKETWDPLPLSKACNPYYEHSGARQHEQQQNPLDAGPFLPEPVYTLVSALHTIQA
jgi:hypothetical protein